MNERRTLKKNSDFRRLYAKGKSTVNPYMAVYCRRTRNGENRLGYTVSTKLGGAVVRNRVRRRFREIVRLHEQELKQGWDIVIVARTRAVGAEYARLDAAFLSACRALGLARDQEVSP